MVDFPLHSSDVIDMHVLADAERIFSPTRLLVLDRRTSLKMFSPLVDIDTIVKHMRLASSVVPVPEVYNHGRSGNCSFVLMQFVQGHLLSNLIRQHGQLVEHVVQPQIIGIVQRLVSVGISHNDLEDRNMLVDDDWNIIAIIDWDLSAPSLLSADYCRRVSAYPWGCHVTGWNHTLLRDLPSAYGASLDANPTGGLGRIRDRIMLVTGSSILQTAPVFRMPTVPWPGIRGSASRVYETSFRIALVLSRGGP
jgi:serine/threonine protein kinase